METEILPIVYFSAERSDPSGRSRALATRFAKERPVILLEQPACSEPGVPDSWDLEFPSRQLLVGRPVLAESAVSAVRRRLPAMLRQLLRWQDVGEWIAWLDAPTSFPLARELAPRLVVYDCGGPAASLHGDPGPHEAALVRAADLLFLGESRADRGSWDGLAEHMLRELALAEQRNLRPLRAREEDLCTPLA
jgi:hypothetical protein